MQKDVLISRKGVGFTISLTIVLLVAYALVMTGATVYFIKKFSASNQKTLSLELLSHDMEKQINSVSEEIALLEKQRAALQETFNELDSNSQKKLTELSTQMESQRTQAQDLRAKLTDAQRQVVTLQEANRKLKSSPKDKDRVSELDGALTEKEAELITLNERISALQKEVRSKESTIHYNLAVNFFDRQDFENSLIEYEKALETDPEHCPSHYNLGILYEEYKNDYPKATYHYRRYLLLCPDAVDAAQVEQWIIDLESRTSSANAE